MVSRSVPTSVEPTSESTPERAPKLPPVDEWKPVLARYQRPSVWHATRQLVDTLAPLAGVWVAMSFLAPISIWLALPLCVLAGLLMVRLFIIFHDCGHGSFFKSRLANDVTGFVAGVLTFTPYYQWRWEHARHHATSGDLDRRGVGDIWTLTVREYVESPRWRRLAYRAIRSPFTLFVLAPIYLFLYQARFPNRDGGPRERRSVWWTNLAILAVMVGMSAWLGVWTYLLLQVVAVGVAGAAGVWLFYVQHQYEDVYWDRGESWDYTAAALRGSSYYRLPLVLRWFTGSIGYHHVHHLGPRVPNYRLARCHREAELFDSVAPLGLLASLRCLRLHLWCETRRRLVGFRDARLGG